MRIVKPNKIGVHQAVATLKQGGVIVYPTDTAYALGGIFNSTKVTKKILKIKKRKDKKFTLIASSLTQVEKFFKLNSLQKKIAQKYWPGPLSIVGSSRFAIRVPKNKIAQALARQVGKPLIATSANLTGNQTLYESKKIIKQFSARGGSAAGGKNKKNQPDLIIDAGRLRKRRTSTVVLVEKGKIKVLRKGPVKPRG
jgi:tRNA threonylcarbamoyl adenosine modification protein (Sua5/YciO/YrdC/YwlC family)